MDYDHLISEALATPFEGWDFDVFKDRYEEHTDRLPWNYEHLVRDRMAAVSSMLDMGTGGGEFLAALAPLPARTAATEGYAPNVPVARARLEPLGVEVVEVGEDEVLAFADEAFELVINRHESFDPGEVYRVLKPGGVFVTQQVGGRDLEEVNLALGGPRHEVYEWDLASAAGGLVEAGFEVTWQEERASEAVFRDVGALVLFLRIADWQVPGFSVEGYDERLRRVHEGMPLRATAWRFALTARKR
ncbi:methyltransferase domain-containing protein [Nonomuraea soli]|uniref:SAM-dependent methyltransferase n=1 Tax=Nonomuraea soli TaxID=1032476 RepID=A0A7W0HML6_9ACTN|nr:methyltransferase domain-containing protein [Nonomuraea soli]MBA2888880.1 SAM-dependent methyltransferase [Nonomuraea soli]